MKRVFGNNYLTQIEDTLRVLMNRSDKSALGSDEAEEDWRLSEFQSDAAEGNDPAKLAAEAEFKERFREAHEHHVTLRQEIGEIQDEIFGWSEDEEDWSP